MESLSNYQKHKVAILKWRMANVEQYNAYHRERRAKIRAQIEEVRNKQVIKDYLEKQLNCV